MGDPSGVGPEVTLKSLEFLGRVTDSPLQNIVIIGSPSIIDETKKRYNIKWDGKVVNCVVHHGAVHRGVVHHVADIKRKDIGYGKVSKLAGQVAYKSILKGHELVSKGEIDALVTAPVCKQSINLIDPEFFGHTELLAKLSGTKRFAMMLAGEEIRVVLVTTHIPISEVATALKEKEIINKIELTDNFLKTQIGMSSPKIGVCALNPHGGEGIFGNEEARIISPAIKKAKAKGIYAEGPYPADTLFALCCREATSGSSSDADLGQEKTPNLTRKAKALPYTFPPYGFDAIIAMYHDQGLIPLKLCEFGGGVNITLGLPFIRTSPDHGTAFDIAGKGVANSSSMIKAIKLAQKLAENSTQTYTKRNETTNKHE